MYEGTSYQLLDRCQGRNSSISDQFARWKNASPMRGRRLTNPRNGRGVGKKSKPPGANAHLVSSIITARRTAMAKPSHSCWTARTVWIAARSPRWLTCGGPSLHRLSFAISWASRLLQELPYRASPCLWRSPRMGLTQPKRAVRRWHGCTRCWKGTARRIRSRRFINMD